MGRRNGHGSLSKKMKSQEEFPRVYIDPDADFASIQIAPGVEKKSYLKEGFIFCEDEKGRVIEVQVLNLSELNKKVPKRAA